MEKLDNLANSGSLVSMKILGYDKEPLEVTVGKNVSGIELILLSIISFKEPEGKN